MHFGARVKNQIRNSQDIGLLERVRDVKEKGKREVNEWMRSKSQLSNESDI